MKAGPARNTRNAPESSETAALANDDLLALWLGLPKQERYQKFADTARAAEITGLSRRTIQFWIEIGAIKAATIGRRYEVDLESLTRYLKDRSEKLR